jgi:hypothetical protein
MIGDAEPRGRTSSLALTLWLPLLLVMYPSEPPATRIAMLEATPSAADLIGMGNPLRHASSGRVMRGGRLVPSTGGNPFHRRRVAV